MGRVFAFVVAKLLRFLTRLRGGGSAFPGLVLLRLVPTVLRDSLGQLPLGVVFVSGSNGKSTTTTMLASLLRAHGLRVFSNPAGGNLPQGLASALVGKAGVTGRVAADIAVLEVDEAYAKRIADAITPDWVVLTNIQVDQLNRFGEPENVYRMLRDLSARATRGVILNQADPNLVAVGTEVDTPGVSVDYVAVSDEALQSAAHGVVAAPRADDVVELPSREPIATLVSTSGQLATISYDQTEVQLDLPAPGLHYAVDALLALGTAARLVPGGLRVDSLQQAMREGAPVYGRGETITHKGVEISLTMMKNLPSLQVNLEAMTSTPELTWVAVDEGTPDPSWLFDIDLGPLDHVDVLSGTKAWQWSVFLEYRGIPYGEVIEETPAALARVVEIARDSKTSVSAIVNYEQMMLIRRLAGYKELEGAR